MGGCRCTYRNCTVKSDGKTHMFHYPVFEKVRCHQWLINAHKLDFLDLKVSQLKNRVICQHHFKDENFMNFKKDKLTFDAIPTEDGPYCDTANYVDFNPDSSKLFPIIIDDLENDYNDKKANYSLKYGDFLANLDLMDLEKIDEDNISYKKSYHSNVTNNLNVLSPHKGKNKVGIFGDDNNFLFNISLPNKSVKKYVTQPTLAVSPYTGISDSAKSYLRHKPNKNNVYGNPQVVINNATKNIKPNQEHEVQPQKKEPKVKIISEKKVTNPVPITGKFEIVSPNFVLNVSRRKSGNTVNSQNSRSILNSTVNKEICNQDKPIEIEVAPLIKEEDNKIKAEESNSLVKLSESNNVPEKSPKVSVIKTRVPPERVEAINKKREFNMKLRDVVETCLDNLDNCSKSNEEIKPQKHTKTKVNKRKVQQESNKNNLPKETPMLNPQEYTIAFLEARLRKMENSLLEKIEQNSMNIIDLKNTFVKTQTKPDEESHKKHLFQEISKYLSATSKSLIYEELFINKFALSSETTTTTPCKRKRKRRY